MKIKEGFVLREIAGSYIVVAVGDAVKTFNGVINLNQTGALLWKELSEGGDEETLLKALLAEYDVSVIMMAELSPTKFGKNKKG